MESRTYRSVLLGSGQMLTGLVGLVSAAILARLLPTSEYGSYRQVFLVLVTMTPFLCLGLPQALYYYLPRAPGDSGRILSSNLLGLVVGGGAFGLFLWGPGADFIAARFNNEDLSGLLHLFAPYVVFFLPTLAVSPCLVSKGRVRLLVAFNVGSRAILLAGAVAPALLLPTARAAVAGNVLAMAIVSTGGLLLMYGTCREGGWIPSRKGLSDQLHYAVPLGVAGMLGAFSANLDKLLVSWRFSPTDLAVYANGAMELPLIGVITGSVEAVLLPELSQLFQRGEHAKALSLWHRAMVKSAVILMPAMVFSLAMAPEIIHLLFSAKYEDSIVPFRIYLLTVPLRTAKYAIIPQAAGHAGLVLLVEGISAALHIIVTLGLISVVGVNGAAVAVVVMAYGAALVGYLPWTRRYMRISWSCLLPWRLIWRVLVASAVPGMVFMLKPVFLGSEMLGLITLGCSYVIAAWWTLSRAGLVGAKTS